MESRLVLFVRLPCAKPCCWGLCRREKFISPTRLLIPQTVYCWGPLLEKRHWPRSLEPCVQVLSSCCPVLVLLLSSCPPAVLWAHWRTPCPPPVLSPCWRTCVLLLFADVLLLSSSCSHVCILRPRLRTLCPPFILLVSSCWRTLSDPLVPSP